MTHIMHTRGVAETNKTKMQVRVGTRYYWCDDRSHKTNNKSGYLPERKERFFLEQQTMMPYHAKVANSSCLKRKEGVVLEQQIKMPHHNKSG